MLGRALGRGPLRGLLGGLFFQGKLGIWKNEEENYSAQERKIRNAINIFEKFKYGCCERFA